MPQLPVFGMPQTTQQNIFGGLQQQQSSQQPAASFNFHAAGAQKQTQEPPSLNFGGQSGVPKLNFGGSGSSGLVFGQDQGQSNLGGASTLQFGQSNSMFPVGGSQSSDGQNPPSNVPFNFNNSGINLNFGGGSSSNPPVFSAGSTDSAVPNRVIRKARRRKP